MKYSRNHFHYAIWSAKKNEDTIKNYNQFVKCCLEGKVDDMLKEIRKKRGNHNTNSSVIDGKVGDEPIANHFSNIYEELFSSVKSDNEMNDFL